MANTADKPFASSVADSADHSRDKIGAAFAPNTTQGMPSGLPDNSGAAPGSNGDAGTQPGEDLLGRVVQGAHQTIDRLAEGAAPHVHKLQEGVASASDQLHHRADQARELGDQWADSLRCTVRDNPLTALAAAVAVGLVLARLSQR